MEYPASAKNLFKSRSSLGDWNVSSGDIGVCGGNSLLKDSTVLEIEPALVAVYVYLVRTASLEPCEIVDGASAGDERALILGRRGSGYGGTSDGTTG